MAKLNAQNNRESANSPDYDRTLKDDESDHEEENNGSRDSERRPEKRVSN